eukprot:CAMPEP_0194028306 /NCGR_PEP_ID=MMETSP0009_2-20130614/2313_1 /TAXON_ID=210454 /ORGANISM="Grammatophora oceanica, Strain CCMP 410" /LENGTH=56 /DNA_ID=CAMNT_0038667657 /DNA_START=547 /DNA_END=717 /DNA_ORIENTATION=-
MTVAGDNSPWAVEKQGNVSQLARTESLRAVACLLSSDLLEETPWVFKSFCALMGGV